jgi:hypothetical protein
VVLFVSLQDFFLFDFPVSVFLSLSLVVSNHQTIILTMSHANTGAGNIGDVGTPGTIRKDHDLVPDDAVRPSKDNYDYHTGRGGAGNEHLAIDHEKKAAEKQLAEGGQASVADKLKRKLFGAFGKK